MALRAALAELPLSQEVVEAVVDASSSLVGLSKHELHEKLKQIGVAKIGLRQKVAVALEASGGAPDESAAAATLRASLNSRDSSLAPHVDALCA